MNLKYYIGRWVGIAPSFYRLATSWSVLGSNPVSTTLSAPVQTGYWDPPNFQYKGYLVFFREVKWTGGCGVEHPPIHRAEVKKKSRATAR
jgi:hypothetical protein